MKLFPFRKLLILSSVFCVSTLQNLISAQNFIKNVDFYDSISEWNSNTINCPTNGSSSWQQYSPNLVAGFPVIWEGTAFLKNKIVAAESDYLTISQPLQGLNPAAGNAIQIKMDLLLGEAKNINLNGAPAEYLNDNLTIELYLGGTLYASVATPKGWKAMLGDEFGKCFVSYFNGATSQNFSTGNTMSNISGAIQAGQAPYLFPVNNQNWDIEIPWDCNKPNTAILEIRVAPNTYFGKSITDTRGQTYLQSCDFNDYSNLDNIAIDNIQLKNKLMPETPTLGLSTITATTCGQSYFDLTTCINKTENCPILNPNAFDYAFYTDLNLTQKIQEPANFNLINNSQTVYVVLTTKITDTYYYVESATKRELTILKNFISTAGSIGNLQEICSADTPNTLTNQISPIIPAAATLYYSWEMAIGSPTANYSPSNGDNEKANYSPAMLTTTNEFITNYYFKRVAISYLNGLSCKAETTPIEVKVLPCAPIGSNDKVEYFDNPGSNLTITAPNTLFGGTTSRGNLVNLKLLRFPNKIASLKITNTTPNGRSNATTTYCPNPANGCVGSVFPAGGLTFPVNAAGNPINTVIELDPQDGSFQTVLPYKVVDNRGFLSTEATSAILFGTTSPLAVNLINFDTKKINQNSIELKWKTSTEIDFSHFIIETSNNNLKFEAIKKVLPNESKNYIAEINDLKSGIHYFRLKMIDTDGTYDYSEIKSVRVEKQNLNTILVKGNPVNEYIKLDLTLETGQYTFKLYDSSGKNIITKAKNITKIETDFPINYTPLKPGIYVLNISNIGGFNQNFKIAVN